MSRSPAPSPSGSGSPSVEGALVGGQGGSNTLSMIADPPSYVHLTPVSSIKTERYPRDYAGGYTVS
ncbi:hypothetical protein ColTof4_04857 [Colletotrichum tofieldiae]|nr:hypothetical protein ColTof3_10894 [Colletotrichum tofieldiae]GKT72434.1 hypothetical protein ColTof4_04857 [Colletotrichum tofieldiae]